ncbi:protein-methionine-sulfoxide reductase catalytic subunit MsrP [Lacibacterium aquatile]|uniref:Protein-methionine-sulfoxide reductase catalytic subunit MsrP n=1 Tax=Lacibacterium aquatile TaxID=1168082 RepID=A0ABW5DS44_9PROT
MLLRIKRSWEMPEREATPESLFFGRRKLLKAGAALGASSLLPSIAKAAGTYPMPRQEKYTLDRPLSEEGIATSYNNFYEFGSSKNVVRAAQALKTDPWTLTIDGMVEKELKLSVDDILAKIPGEERLYRHRCVEAWSMSVPWSGIPLAELVKLAAPKNEAKYVRFETFMDTDMAPGQKQFWYTWPYVEGVTMAEAMNELPFLATGVYGKPLPKQMGAPIRLVLPWKYGFKSIKSIVKMSFTDKRPTSFWELMQAQEYGFWANVNPEVAHPRWSQKTERTLAGDTRATLLFNGYGEQVAHLYKDIQGEQLYR